MATVSTQQQGNKLVISIEIKGDKYGIFADTIDTPDGKSIIYDCYIISQNRLLPNATDIDFYVDIIKRAASNYENGLSAQDSIRKLTQEHVGRFGRIIDTDLMMIVSAVQRVMKSIDGESDLKELIMFALQLCLNDNLDKTFVTLYNETPNGVVPQLIKLVEFAKNY